MAPGLPTKLDFWLEGNRVGSNDADELLHLPNLVLGKAAFCQDGDQSVLGPSPRVCVLLPQLQVGLELFDPLVPLRGNFVIVTATAVGEVGVVPQVEHPERGNQLKHRVRLRHAYLFWPVVTEQPALRLVDLGPRFLLTSGAQGQVAALTPRSGNLVLLL